MRTRVLALAGVAAGLLGVTGVTGVANAKDEPTLTAIHCGTLLAVPGEDPLHEVTLLIEGGEVLAVEAGYQAHDGARTIDLKDRFVMPGLIDCHTHITGELHSHEEGLRRTLAEGPTYTAVDGTVFAERTLMAGFTTIRNVGSAGSDIYALRDRINSGFVVGPRILAAGQAIGVTGGHADDTNGISPLLRPEMGPMEGVADGPFEVRKAVRERVKRGSDLIKITATGGVLSNTAAGVDQQMFEDELKAAVDTAHSLGRKIAAHAHGTNGINAALRAGVDSIEHGTYLDDESIELFLKTGAYLVPTIHAGKFVAAKAEEPAYFNEAIKAKAAAVGPQIQGSFAKAYKAGVKIAFGTDVGVGEHGTNWLEFVYMTEAGMPNAEALACATVHAADLLGLSDTIGTLETGKQADLIAVGGDPLEDIHAMGDVVFVMKGGRVFKD